MATANTKKAPAQIKVRTNAYVPITLTKIPPLLLQERRSRDRYGWEELKIKQAKLFPRAQYANAYQSAMKWAKEHDVELRAMANTDGDGNVITEKVYMIDGKEVPLNEVEGLKPEKFTTKNLPVNYLIVRVK